MATRGCKRRSTRAGATAAAAGDEADRLVFIRGTCPVGATATGKRTHGTDIRESEGDFILP